MSRYLQAMLHRAFVIMTVGACHPAPVPTVVHAPSPAAAAPVTRSAPVRQDFELVLGPAPLAEVIATGHECRAESSPIERPRPGTHEPVQGPIDDTTLHPIERPLDIMAEPTACQADRHRRLLVQPAANYR
jgi:hypothetical protein